jgi:hypothetical protein
MSENNEEEEDGMPPIPHIATAAKMLRKGLLLLIQEKLSFGGVSTLKLKLPVIILE